MEALEQSNNIRPVYQKLLESAEWKSQTTKHIDQHPMLIFLRNGKTNNDYGWLRKEEASVRQKAIAEGKQREHLDSIEKDLLAKIHCCIEDVKEHKTPSKKFSPIADLAYAFGVSTRSVRNSKTNDYEANGTNKQKQRSDAGRTFFNSVAKRDQTWTPEMYHSKKQRILARGCGVSSYSNTVIIEPTSLKLYYSPDPKEQQTNTMTTGLHRIKILEHGVDAPVHATSAICKDSQTSRPRATLTNEIIKSINPTVIDNLVGEVVHIKFESGRKNTVFFASSTSTCPLLKQLYNCFEESRHKLEILVKDIPNSLWIPDTLAGGNYIPIGVSFRSGTQGSSKKLPFLRAECSNNRLICISRIYAKLLGIEAAIIKKYCPQIYKTNHDTYRGGEDCMFPPIHEQHAGQTTSELFHFYLNQVALRVLYNETDKTEEQLHRCAMHTDDGDVSTDQPLTFLSFGGEEGSGGEVSGSDLIIFEQSDGGQSIRLKTSTKSTVVVIVFNSREQLHGNFVDMSQRSLDTSCWNLRLIPYGRINVLDFISRRNNNEVKGECFRDIKLQTHTTLKDGEFHSGDLVSAEWSGKLIAGKVSFEEGQLCIIWTKDGKKTKWGARNVYSFECSQSLPHDCPRCNPSEDIIFRQ